MKRQNKKNLLNLNESEVIPGIASPHIEIDRNSCVSVEGVKGILEYDGSVIKIDCEDIILKFTGDAMEIDSMLSERISICGNILSVEFFT